MKWFKRVDDDGTSEEMRKSYSLQEIYRNFAYDAGIEDPESIIRALADQDYVPMSEEGVEKMMQDSDSRLVAISNVLPLLHIQATFAAAAYVELYARLQDIDDDDRVMLLNTFLPFAHSILIASYAGLCHYLDGFDV